MAAKLDSKEVRWPEQYLSKGKYWFPGKDELSEREWNVLVYGEKALKDAENLSEKLGDEYDKFCLHLGQPFLPEFDMTPEEKKKYNDSVDWPEGLDKPDLAAALKPIALMKHAYGLDDDPNAMEKIRNRFHLRNDYTEEEKERRRKIQQERHEMYSKWADEVVEMNPQPHDPTIPSEEEVKFFKEMHGLDWGKKKLD